MNKECKVNCFLCRNNCEQFSLSTICENKVVNMSGISLHCVLFREWKKNNYNNILEWLEIKYPKYYMLLKMLGDI